MSAEAPKKEKYSTFFESSTVAIATVITVLELVYLGYVFIFG